MILEIDGHAAYAYTGGKTLRRCAARRRFHPRRRARSQRVGPSNALFRASRLRPGARSSPGARTQRRARAFHHRHARRGDGAESDLRGPQHGLSSLIALDAAARHPARTTGLALLATAAPMTVSDTLLDAAREHEPEAIDMVNQWSHSTIAAKSSSPAPGFWLQGVNQRLMERVSLLGEALLFHTDFSTCNAYVDALERAAAVRCPVCVVSGKRDMMMPAARRAAHRRRIEASWGSGADGRTGRRPRAHGGAAGRHARRAVRFALACAAADAKSG